MWKERHYSAELVLLVSLLLQRSKIATRQRSLLRKSRYVLFRIILHSSFKRFLGDGGTSLQCEKGTDPVLAILFITAMQHFK